jgi:hypothetical protein
MEVSYHEGVQCPADATNTEITTYMWPGFLGELDHSTLVFQVWELIGPTLWKPRPDILGPPFECMGVHRSIVRKWESPKNHWMQEGPLQRHLLLP